MRDGKKILCDGKLIFTASPGVSDTDIELVASAPLLAENVYTLYDLLLPRMRGA